MKEDHVGNLNILGIKCLKQNELVFDLHNRKISKLFNCGTIWNCFIDRNGGCKVLWSAIPVAVSEAMTLRAGDSTKVDVCWTFPGGVDSTCDCSGGKSEVMFVDELSSSSYVQLVGGLVSDSVSAPSVILINNGTKSEFVKPSKIIGTISSAVCENEIEQLRHANVVMMEPPEEGTSGEEDLCSVELQNHLSEKEKSAVLSLLRKHKAVFGNNGSVGKLNVIAPHKLELTDYNPIYQRPRRFPEKVTEEIDAQCRELELLDIIEPSQSVWSSPVVPIRKKDGAIRLCVDYRKLNEVTRPDKFPLPNLSDAVFGLYGVKYFTTFDMIKGYYQVPLDEESRQYTAFSTPRRHWQFKRLSFGLKNAPSAFQRTMQSVLSGFSWRKVVVYIDDVLIMGSSYEEHLELCDKVLRTLTNHGVMLKLSKCKWFCKTVEFLGHVISVDGLSKPDSYVKTVANFPQPKTKTQLREFLGLLNFQRKFIPNCSLVMRPLSQATGGNSKKKGKIEWTDEMDAAFNSLKELMVKEVTLAYPDYSEEAQPLLVYTDASGYGIGSCLAQVQNDNFRIVAYASVAFNETELKYSTLERELAAIRWAVKTFRPFLFGIEFVIHTDHRPLIHLYNLQIVNMRLARTLRELSEYNFVIKYTPGRANTAADTLSRMEKLGPPDEADVQDYGDLPAGLLLARTVPGGGDSLVESLHVAASFQQFGVTLPGTMCDLREVLVQELMRDTDGYFLRKDKTLSRRLKLMMEPGQLLCDEIMMAFAHLFKCIVFVHVGSNFPVLHVSPTSATSLESPRIHLQCLAGVHFNPLMETINYKVPGIPISPSTSRLNQVPEPKEEEEAAEVDLVTGGSSLEYGVLEEEPCTSWCSKHPRTHEATILVQLSQESVCVLLDTGAQVSCVQYTVVANIGAVLRNAAGLDIIGIGTGRNPVIGKTTLVLNLGSCDVEHEFAVVEDSCMSFCFVFGADLMEAHKFNLDFSDLTVTAGRTVLNMSSLPLDTNLHSFSSSEIDVLCLTQTNLFIDESELRELQKNSQLSQVKRKVENGDDDRWPVMIKKYKYYRCKL